MADHDGTIDADLIRLAQNGSSAALEALYLRYLPPVWRYVYTRLAGDVHAAEDVVSETWLAAVRGLADLDPNGGSFCGWLMSVARHKLGDRLRHACRQQKLRMTTAAVSDGSALIPDPSADLVAQERRRRVAETMVRLPDEQRLVLEWKYLDKLSVRDIADRMGRTEKAVENLLYRARQSFRKLHGDG